MHCQFYLAIFIVVLMAINLNCVSAKPAESEEIDNYYKKYASEYMISVSFIKNLIVIYRLQNRETKSLLAFG